MSGQIALAKDRIRNDMRCRRAALSRREASAAAALAAVRIEALVLSGAGLVAAYRAVRGELSVNALADGEQWNRFTFPRVNGHDLEFVARCEREAFTSGAFSIPEPVGGRIVALVDHAAVLVPLTAFDDRCCRIGQGGGFYDRALAAAQTASSARSAPSDICQRFPVAIGVAYAFQQIDEVPTEPWDVPLDAVITDAGLFTAPNCRWPLTGPLQPS